MMTLEQFRATKTRCEDLGAALSFDTGSDLPVAGWIYDNHLHIEDATSWGDGTQDLASGGKFYLLLERCDWFSDDIEELERRLFMWRLRENDADLDQLFGAALDLALAHIQDALGVKTGDYASHHFSGEEAERFRRMMHGYVVGEMFDG